MGHLTSSGLPETKKKKKGKKKRGIQPMKIHRISTTTVTEKHPMQVHRMSNIESRL